MFENILIGPLCLVLEPDDRSRFLRDMTTHGYFPLMEVNSGELFEKIKAQMPIKNQLISILVPIGYSKLYY